MRTKSVVRSRISAVVTFALLAATPVLGVSQIGEPQPVSNPPLSFRGANQSCGCMDMVFVIDLTASMGGALNNLMDPVAGLPFVIDQAVSLSGGNLRLGLITFSGDGAGDFVEVVHTFTTDVNALKSSIASLGLGDGGNVEEASDEALREMLSGTACRRFGPDFTSGGGFRPECIKHAMLVTDNRPAGCNDLFEEGIDDINADARANEAAALDVILTAAYVGGLPPGSTDPVSVAVMKNYARKTAGVYAPLPGNGEGIGQVLYDAMARCGDCNNNGIADILDILEGTSEDCSMNGTPDECEPDCNNNSTADSCDIVYETSADCSGNEIPDECEPDCNLNGVADSCDILSGYSNDCTRNGIPDECEPDCNHNGQADSCDILYGVSQDCDRNGIPDECMAAATLILYVDSNAVGNNDGSSWEDAYRDLKTALPACSAVCTSTEVWVARGHYYPAPSSPFPSRSSTFDLCSALAMYGGFTATEMTREQRDPEANVTVLSGDLKRDDGTVGIADNAYHVVRALNVNNTGVLDGFVIRRGNADGNEAQPFGRGGGLYIQGGDPTVRSVKFIQNAAKLGGGAAAVSSSAPSFSRCSFDNNTASVSGGGLLIMAASAQVGDSLFVDNSASATGSSGGGGIFVSNSSGQTGTAHIEDSVFVDNTADYGGGIDVWHSTARAVNCTFTDNMARVKGGAAEVSYLPNTNPQSSALNLINCVLWGNNGPPTGHELATTEGSNSYLTVGSSTVQNGEAAIDHSGGGHVTYAASNITADPQFIDVFGRIDPASPCTDAGDTSSVGLANTLDYDGHKRIADGDLNGTMTVDMGAFEYVPCVHADVNCDGSVNGSDILSVRAPSTWNHAVVCPNGPTDPNPRADVNNSGFIDGSDILSIRAPGAWNTSTGECYCVPGCPAQQGLLEGGEYMAGYSSGESPAPSWSVTNGDLALEFQPVGGGGALSTLVPHTTYEVHYATSLAIADYFVGVTAESAAAIADADPAPAGPWADPDHFLFESGAVLFDNDLRPGGRAAGSSGVLCRISAGEIGTLILEVTLTWTNEETSEGGVAPGSVTIPVQ